jgi:hypothetical protein
MIQLLAWEERNYIEQMKNSDNKKVSETKDTMTETKTSLIQNDWRDITDPKLRKKMRLKAKSQRGNQRFKERNPEYHKEYRKTYRVKNKIELNSKYKEWCQKNKEKRRAYMNTYTKKRRDQDIQFRIITTLRSRFYQAVKKNHKTGSAIKNLGCSIIQLKSYLESKFLCGMSWDNYGLEGWHIDHIKPLSAFDLSNEKEMLKACHYTNLQPLWAKDNLSKGNK